MSVEFSGSASWFSLWFSTVSSYLESWRTTVGPGIQVILLSRGCHPMICKCELYKVPGSGRQSEGGLCLIMAPKPFKGPAGSILALELTYILLTVLMSRGLQDGEVFSCQHCVYWLTAQCSLPNAEQYAAWRLPTHKAFLREHIRSAKQGKMPFAAHVPQVRAGDMFLPSAEPLCRRQAGSTSQIPWALGKWCQQQKCFEVTRTLYTWFQPPSYLYKKSADLDVLSHVG